MNYANLIQNITENIKTNGSQAITAQVLQDVLVDMVGELGQSGALLGGVIDTSFVPDTTNDAQVVYIAESPGTYTNFNGLVVGAGEVAFFYFDGNAWAKSSVDVLEVVNNLNSTATDKALSAAMGKQLGDNISQLGQKVADNTDTIEETITVVKSANLLNPAACVLGYINKSDGTIGATSDRYVSDFIPVSENGLYCNAYNGYGMYGRAAVYDANKNFLRELTAPAYTYQNGDAFVRWTLDKTKVETPTAYIIDGTSAGTYTPYFAPKYYIKEASVPTIGTSKLADGAVTEVKIANDAVTTDKVSDDAITIDKIAFKHIAYGINRANPATCVKGYVSKETGDVVSINDRYVTDYIPISQLGLYCGGYEQYGVLGTGAVYDSNKAFVRGLQGADSPYIYQYQDGDAFVRWTVSTESVETPDLYVIEGTSPGQYTPYTAPSKLLNEENLPVFGTSHIQNGAVTSEKLAGDIEPPSTKPAISLCGKDCIKETAASIAVSGSLQITDFPQYLKANGIVSFFAKLTSFNDLSVGFGTSTNSIQVKVDGTNIYFIKSGSQVGSAVAHGLTISDFIDITFDNDFFHPKVVVSTLSGIFVHDGNEFASLESYGYPVAVMGTGTAVTDAELRATSDKFNKPIWVVGDSYTSFYDERWTKQMVKTIRIDKFLVIGLAGGGSSGMYADLQKALAFGSPKFLVWCLGMNDTAEGWEETFDNLKTLCASMGTELILQTIPIPNLETSSRQVAINTAIKASGYRYIDACAAMCPNNTYPWYEGYCSDGVHPTVLGAKVLAARFLSDFPEFLQ